MQRRLFASALSTVLGVLLMGACGSDRPPISGDQAFPDQDASVGFTTEGGSLCDTTLVDGGPCGCLEISLLTDQPNLYFVLDRSGSMLDDGKWQTVRQVVANVVEKIGPRAKFGVALFSDPAGQGCTPGKEVMPVRTGDSPAGTAGVTTNEVIATTSVGASGGTPTATTLLALAPAIEALPGRTFVILATDGGPNCNGSAICDAAHCIANIENVAGCPTGGPFDCCTNTTGAPDANLNCLDADPTIDAIAALKTKNVPTYVVGIPGSAPYASLLDQLALAGGTARGSEPQYYSVSSTGSAAIDAALAQIAAKITATCVFPLAPVPPHPELLNIYFDDVVVPQDATNGWTYADGTVTLVGSACDRVLSGEVLNLRVIAGCPTVIPR
ncbi:MAG: vWA domain-containing protein [Polyangiaceae bacterium]